MHRFAVLLFLLSCAAALQGQSATLRSLASEFCACMEEIGKEQPLRRSLRCQDRLLQTNQQRIATELGLDLSISDEREQFLELLIDVLVVQCPLLQTLSVTPAERDLRWSDIPPVKIAPPRYRSDKMPPPPVPDFTVGEVPDTWRARGSITGRPTADRLQLRLEDGHLLRFIVNGAILRERRWKDGDKVAVDYRREWHKDGGEIVNFLLAITLEE
ncbi:hypothetical protein QWY85_15945 [Neolewinella lacunae]|uniref:Uncharacterized protein n=1 Tax=Neolewinella lacunae TaxID=1517758 RepID=A0A923T7G7_9BACT|nr:hypothetical protein [Neolewinella lacunae]MBC6993564.1 hypothetical protein [Neolewinella lacunae]MDN3636160.1 hypothetical protein [Neolewinella lacunae]